MKRRMELQTLLEEILGSKHVYFSPPESVKLRYPCIIYKKSDEIVRHADDIPYKRDDVYEVTVIDRNPDSDIPDKIANLQSCRFTRSFTSDNLSHHVYRLAY